MPGRSGSAAWKAPDRLEETGLEGREGVGAEPDARARPGSVPRRLELGEGRRKRVRAEPRLPAQRRDGGACEAGARHAGRDARPRVAGGERCELVREGRVAPAPPRRRHVEHAAAALRRPGLGPRETAQHEAVPREERERGAVDVEARQPRAPWRDRLGADRREARAALGGPDQELDGRPALDGGCARKPAQGDVEDGRLLERARRRELLATGELAELDAVEVHRAAPPGATRSRPRAPCTWSARTRAPGRPAAARPRRRWRAPRHSVPVTTVPKPRR